MKRGSRRWTVRRSGKASPGGAGHSQSQSLLFMSQLASSSGSSSESSWVASWGRPLMSWVVLLFYRPSSPRSGEVLTNKQVTFTFDSHERLVNGLHPSDPAVVVNKRVPMPMVGEQGGSVPHLQQAAVLVQLLQFHQRRWMLCVEAGVSVPQSMVTVPTYPAVLSDRGAWFVRQRVAGVLTNAMALRLTAADWIDDATKVDVARACLASADSEALGRSCVVGLLGYLKERDRCGVVRDFFLTRDPHPSFELSSHEALRLALSSTAVCPWEHACWLLSPSSESGAHVGSRGANDDDDRRAGSATNLATVPGVSLPADILVSIVDSLTPHVDKNIAAHKALMQTLRVLQQNHIPVPSSLAASLTSAGVWYLAASLVSMSSTITTAPPSLLRMSQGAVSDELRVRAHFQVGDWRGALRFYLRESRGSQLSDRVVSAAVRTDRMALDSLVFQLLVEGNLPLQACTWMRRHRSSVEAHATSAARLLLQLAQKKQSQRELAAYTEMIDEVIETLQSKKLAGHPLVDLAVGSALAVCGAWKKVLRLLADATVAAESKPVLQMSLFMNSAAGGAPYDVIHQFLSAFAKRHFTSSGFRHEQVWGSSPSSSSGAPSARAFAETLIRCALECGRWQEAVRMFHRLAPEARSPQLLDHPSLVAPTESLGSPLGVEFSPDTLMECGMWERALASIGASRPSSVTLRRMKTHPRLWAHALRFVSHPSEYYSMAVALAAERSSWAQGLHVLRCVVDQLAPAPSVQQFVAKAVATALATHNPNAALSVLASSVCVTEVDSFVAAARVLQEELLSGSDVTLRALLPTAHWTAALEMLQQHTSLRPSAGALMDVIVSSVLHLSAMRHILLVRVLTPKTEGRKGRRSYEATFCFEAVRSASAGVQRKTETSSTSGGEGCWESASVTIKNRGTEMAESRQAMSWQRAVSLLQQPISAVSRHPWRHLAMAPTSVLASLLRLPTTVCTPDRVSMAVDAALSQRHLEAALELVSTAAEVRSVFPELRCVVDMTELAASRQLSDEHDVASLARTVETLRRVLPEAIVKTSLRAFAERRAAQADGRWEHALDLLSSLAVVGAHHLPASTLQRIATFAPLPAVRFALKVLGSAAAREREAASAPMITLDVHAVRSLVQALEASKLSTSVDWIAVPSAQSASARLPQFLSTRHSSSTSRLLKSLLREKLTSMWLVGLRVAFRCDASLGGGLELPRDASLQTVINARRALLLTVAGCGDCDMVRRLFAVLMRHAHSNRHVSNANPAVPRLLVPQRGVGWPRRRLASINVVPLELHCVCACELARRGEWMKALDLVLEEWSRFPEGHHPPLLQRTRMAVLECSDRFPDGTLTALLQAQRASSHRQGNLTLRSKQVRDMFLQHAMQRPFVWFY